MLNVLPATATTFDLGEKSSQQPGELIMTPKSNQDTTTVAVGTAAADAVRNYGHHHHTTEDVEDAAVLFAELSVRCEFTLGAWDNGTTTSTTSNLSLFQNNPLQQFSSEHTRWGGCTEEIESDSDDSSDDDDDDWEDDDFESVRLCEEPNGTPRNNDNTSTVPSSSSSRVRFCECLVTQINEYTKPSPELGHLLHYSGQEIQQFKNEYDHERRNMSLLERLGSS
mmetsp:Transcript_24127/g.33713  ORF Transcript_24127/g.33713 Transcript_24127/m.33713 type:complete len:224 (-) Transcript_24127:66-737(-)